MAIYGFSGKKQVGKDTCVKIWQLLDVYHSNILPEYIYKNKSDIEFVLGRLNKPKKNLDELYI